MEQGNTRRLAYGGLMTALVFVATTFIPQVPIPFTEGYIHTGDSMIFVAAILLGWRYGAIAGGIGSAMADLYLGFYHWIIPTLIIKSIMGAIVGVMAGKSKTKTGTTFKNALTGIIGSGWFVLAILMKRILRARLGNLSGNDLALSLVKDFNLKNLGELNALIGSVQTALTAALIGIPIFIVIMVLVLRRKDKQLFSISNFTGMTLAGVWMVVGYYFAGGLLKGNMIVPIFSVPANILQFIGGAMIAFPILLALKKTKYFDTISEKL